jgi:hypothetical protein
MQTNSLLACTLATLLSGLAAQDPTPRTPFSLPPSAAEAVQPDAASAAVLRQVREQLGARHDGNFFQQVRFDRPRADGPLWALGSAWKASFDANGTTVIPFFGSTAPQNFPLHLRLAKATIGGEPLPLAAGEPVRDATSVRTSHGALTEVIDTHLDDLEQSFVFDTLPNRGAIAVDVRMDSELLAQPIENGVRFANEFGHVDYTKAIAVDAKGQRLPLDIVWTGTAAHMEIPASFVANAQLPIVLDPVLNYWYGLGSGQTQLQHDSDVASIQAPGLGGRTLIVWQRQWSSTDQDCYGVMFDNNLGLVQTDFAIDFTTADWLKVAVAGNNYAQNFLVTAEIRAATSWFIGGRMIAANATQGAVFDIERNGVVGLPGNSYAPDVGGDPYFGVGRYCVVFMKRPSISSNADTIYFKQVTTTGALVTTNPILIDSYANGVDHPSISKSCGQSNGLPAYWLLSWQRTWLSSPNDQEVHGSFVNWNGAIAGTTFPIATSVAEESRPSSSSPIDSNGTRLWPVAFEVAQALGQPRDIVCRLMRSDGTFQAGLTVSNGVSGTDEREPSCDSDGTRFVVAMTTSAGSPQGVEAATVAYLPGTNTFRIEERSILSTTFLESFGPCSVVAEFSGGQAMTPRYYLSFTERNTNTFRLEAFGGYVGNTNFFSYRPSQCGNLPISATGSPAIGQTVSVTVFGSGFTGTLLGFPAHVPLTGSCNCWLGVDPSVALSSPLNWTVPNNPAYVGLALSVQGWSFSGTQCIGTIDLSDTVDFTVR